MTMTARKHVSFIVVIAVVFLFIVMKVDKWQCIPLLTKPSFNKKSECMSISRNMTEKQLLRIHFNTEKNIRIQ